jgi:hypothetical protein
MSYIQFRLSNGDEIVCQVMEEPEEDDTNIVIRSAMMICAMTDGDGMRYRTFRPWMALQASDQYFQLLNYSHIVGEAKPDSYLLEQYYKALKSEKQADQEYQEQVEAKYEAILARLAELSGNDSDQATGNVISLFDKNKLN